jgi:hypothetical protein
MKNFPIGILNGFWFLVYGLIECILTGGGDGGFSSADDGALDLVAAA